MTGKATPNPASGKPVDEQQAIGSVPESSPFHTALTALEKEYVERATVCDGYARDRRLESHLSLMAAKFHKGAAMAFRDMASRLADQLAALLRSPQ